MIKLDFLLKKSSFSCADIVGILKNTKNRVAYNDLIMILYLYCENRCISVKHT